MPRNQPPSCVVQDGVMRHRRAASLRVMLLWMVATVSFAAFVLGTSERVGACSCAAFTDEEALENADAAFTGTLVEIITPKADTYSSTDPERFVFAVDEVFKGEVFARQSVLTARDGASCGLEIHGPGPFVVFADESDSITSGAADGELYSNLCSGTRVVTTDALPASFGTASAPAAGASPIGVSGTQRPTVQIVVILGALALLGAASAFAVRRRRHSAGVVIRRRFRS